MKTNLVLLKSHKETPPDVAISRQIQNLFATYGESKVRSSMKTLFSMETKKSSKKAA